MRNKLFFVSVFMILAVIVSACGSAVAQAPSTEPAKRTLSVNGSAQAYLTPDIAYISVGVHTENEDASKAVADSNVKAKGVVDALQGMGIDPKDIRTTNFNIYPSQQYTPEGQLKGTIYMVDNSVYVTLRDLDKIGDVLGKAVSAGANSISGIQFDVADKNTALADARKAAVANARSLAQELAGAAGVTLGEIQSINYYSSAYSPMPVFEGKGGGVATDASVPISTGQISLSVDVSMVFAIQ